MKKVTTKNEETVCPCCANNHKYYGFVNATGEKGFVIQKEWHHGPFRAVAIKSITHCNGRSDCDAPSLKETLDLIVSKDNWQAFEFDTPEELFKWLLE